MSSDVAEIKALLSDRIEALAEKLCPDGRRNGRYWIATSPLRADRNAGSFWINLSGPMQGTYHDAASGETGDMLRLIQGTYGYDFKGAMDFARDFLGLAKMSKDEVRDRVHAAKEKAQTDERQDEASEERGRRWAFGVFVAAKKNKFLGSPADLYLQSRGINVRELKKQPGALGWLDRARHRETGTFWPVMVAAFTCPLTLKVVALHRTFLTPDGHKAPVKPVRKMFPGVSGAAMRMWRGESGLSPEEAAKNGLLETLILTEGVEDALSIALACPQHRIWAVGSLNNLGKVVLPQCCDRVIVAADNDWGKRQAQRQLDQALAWLMRQGAEVSIARSAIGKDANDALMKEM